LERKSRWQRALKLALAIAAAWLALWLLGPTLLPFLLGLAIAKAADPAVRVLHEHAGVPRWLAAAMAVSGVWLVLLLTLFLLGRLLWTELTEFVRALPELLQSMAASVEQLKTWLLSLTEDVPPGIGEALREGVSDFFANGAGLPQKLYDRLFAFVSRLLKAIPDLALFLLTTVLSGFMLSAQLPRLLEFWRKKAPALWQKRSEVVARRLKRTLGGWFKAQLKLILVTFLILTVGFFLLRIHYPLLFSTFIALIDALPVFGTGTVLIPWSIFSFLQGNTFRGIGLLCVYGTASLVRTALEPRMLGKQFGLNPLATLAAIYGGYSFFGVLGMLLFPMIAMLAKQFWRGEDG